MFRIILAFALASSLWAGWNINWGSPRDNLGSRQDVDVTLGPRADTRASSSDPRCVSRVANLTSTSTTFQTRQPPSARRLSRAASVSTSPSAKVFSVNFFACAEGAKYERFLPMYAFFALQSNRNSAAELVVPNSTLFLKRHERALTVVKQLHGRGSVWVREYRVPRHRGVMPNTRRFLEVPEIAAEYVYMGDIDILITESVLSAGRLQQMRHNAPYSNILRKHTRRLTGVILVRAREFYTGELQRAQVALLAGGNATGNDEEFLARLVTAASFALPPANETYRPLHGLHLSNSRGPNSVGKGKAMGISDKDSQWCPVLGTPGFQEYISIDDHARTTLQSFATYAVCLHPSRAQDQEWVRPLQPREGATRKTCSVARPVPSYKAKPEKLMQHVCFSQATRNAVLSLPNGSGASTAQQLVHTAFHEQGVGTPDEVLTNRCPLLLPLATIQSGLHYHFRHTNAKDCALRGARQALQGDRLCTRLPTPTTGLLGLIQVLHAAVCRSPVVLKDSALAATADKLGIVHSSRVASRDDAGVADSNFDTVLRLFSLDRFTLGRLVPAQRARLHHVDRTVKVVISCHPNACPNNSNAGDAFGPLAAAHIARMRQMQLSFVSTGAGGVNQSASTIAVVGSIIQFIQKRGFLIWGAGLIGPVCTDGLQRGDRVLAVRGPRSRDRLLLQHGINPLVLGDPALLAPELFPLSSLLAAPATPVPSREVCFVIHSVDRSHMLQLCPLCMQHLVNNYVSLAAGIENGIADFLRSLVTCKRVVSTSLHGVIFAHAFAIPAAAIQLGDRITGGSFKFVDHMHSIGLHSFRAREQLVLNASSGKLIISTLTLEGWSSLVDRTPQPRFPVDTRAFHKTFPAPSFG